MVTGRVIRVNGGKDKIATGPLNPQGILLLLSILLLKNVPVFSEKKMEDSHELCPLPDSNAARVCLGTVDHLARHHLADRVGADIPDGGE